MKFAALCEDGVEGYKKPQTVVSSMLGDQQRVFVGLKL